MSRTLAFTAAAIAALAVALPAAADHGLGTRGTLVSVSDTSVSIKHGHHVLSCNVGPASPSLAGYANGDWVRAVCRRVGGRRMLVRIHHLTTRAAGRRDVAPVRFAGAVTALTDTSISLHDGDRDLTCAIDSTSPATDGLKVGQHAKVLCVNGVLTQWMPVTRADAARVYTGVVTATSPGLSLHTEHGDVTCGLGAESPSVANVGVGDQVLIGCRVGSNLLVYLKPLSGGDDNNGGDDGTPAPAPPTAHTVTGSAGPLTSITDTSITLHNAEHGADFTCSLGEHSPSLDDYELGDRVKMLCTDGVLTSIAKVT